MKEKIIDENLRNKINSYLNKEYNLLLPENFEKIIEEENDYLYINDDPEIFIYIPKI